MGRLCSQILTVTSIWEADVVITLLIFMKNQNIFITQNRSNTNHISMKSVATSTKKTYDCLLEGKLFFSLRKINKLQEVIIFVHKCCRFLEHAKQCGVLHLAHLQLVFLFWYEDYLDRGFISVVCHFLVMNML